MDKGSRSQGPGKHGGSLCFPTDCTTLASRFTHSFTVCLRQSLRDEVSWQSLCWNRGHSALLQQTANCGTFLIYCFAPAQMLSWPLQAGVGEIPAENHSILCRRGLRQVYSAIRQCWHQRNGDSTQLGYMNWILLFTGSLQNQFVTAALQ